MLVPIVLSLLVSSPRVISDRRPLPSDTKNRHREAQLIVSGEETYNIDFEKGEQRLTERGDTIQPPRLSGFDKGLNSGRESFFITNGNEDELRAVTIEIEYLTEEGEMLHKRSVPVTVAVPSGETRRVDIQTWDRQHQFYYYLTSPRPQRAATPFRVRLRPLRATYRTP